MGRKNFSIVVSLSEKTAEAIRQLPLHGRSKVIQDLIRNTKKDWVNKDVFFRKERKSQVSLSLPGDMIEELGDYNIASIIEYLVSVYELE